MKVIIIGGHLTPALAVIEALPKDTHITYIGRKYTFEKDRAVSLEYQTIIKRGIPFEVLTTGRLQRTFTRETLPSLAKIPKGFIQSLQLLKKHKPDVIIGFGGYLSVPVGFAGKLLGIPLIIHEQTLEAGFANKLLSLVAAKICISWDSSRKFFPHNKTVLTGNPLPQSMFSHVAITAIQKSIPRICIIGGSSGSHALNLLIEGVLEQLVDKFVVIHQTGDAQEFKDFDRLQTVKHTLPAVLQKRYTIIKFIEPNNFISTLQQADLVVTRSGINTVTALLLLQKMSVCIPLPIAQRNEQYKNACLLKDTGLAEILDQNNTTPQILFDKIVFMLNNKRSYEKNISKAKSENVFLPSKKIVDVINDIYQTYANKKKESNY